MINSTKINVHLPVLFKLSLKSLRRKGAEIDFFNAQLTMGAVNFKGPPLSDLLRLLIWCLGNLVLSLVKEVDC